MAAGTLSKPGAKYGPCKTGCAHRDCAATRKMAEGKCPLCLRPIGYETLFVITRKGDEAVPVHADCFEDAAEATA